MKVVNMGNIADAFKFDDLPATGIVIEATPEELKLLPNLAYKDVTISEHISSVAAMREALNGALEAVKTLSKTHNDDLPEDVRVLLGGIAFDATAALSTPPRNCDVGTAYEQHARFYSFCDKFEECKECPLWRGGGLTSKCCAHWGQMPYEGADAK